MTKTVCAACGGGMRGKMSKLGVIGGLGPMATALFMKMVIEMTDAAVDQEHIEMIIYNCPRIPDRTKFILGLSREDPSPEMIRIGKSLEAQGADLIAIPCITANYFYGRLTSEIHTKIINIIEEICFYLTRRKVSCAGLMATTGTIESRLFQEVFEANGCRLVVPSKERQQDVMYVIYQDVKANRPVDMERFFSASRELREAGAEVIILGCTELSVVRENYQIGAGFLDAMQLMAKCAVETCGRLREEYRELITKPSCSGAD